MTPEDQGGPGKGRPDTTHQQSESYSEDVATIGELVAGILDGAISDLPAELAGVMKIRAATRRVLEARLHPVDEDRLLGALARQAARSPLPLWALEAMEREILEPEPPELLPADVVGRARTLRRWGHSACPTCHVQLIIESQIERDDHRRRWAAEDQEVRRRAVPQGLAS